MDAHPTADGVANAFLRDLLDDLERGAPRAVSEYQARYPGHDALIAARYAALIDSDADASGGSASADGGASEPPASSAAASAASSPPSTLAPGIAVVTERGEYLDGYRLIREIGRGGQGAVYLAEDESLGRTVAIKLLTLYASGGREVVDRFRREARVASRLDHPGICTVHATGSARGVPYVVMRHVPGETLAKRIGERTRPPARAELADDLGLVEDAARALHAAHEAGVVHRDVKPANVMVTPEGRPVILDFGLARDLGDDEAVLTRTGDVFGTPAYMAPEQVRGDNRPDPRTDVHALGVALYELATGARPYQASTRESLYREILNEPPPDCRRLNPAIPRDLKVVIDTALAKSPDARYLSADEFAQDLRAVREHRPIAAVPPSRLTRLRRWARREPGLASLAAALVVALTAAAASLGYQAARAPLVEAGRLKVTRERIEALLLKGFSMSGGDANLAALREVLSLDPDHELARAGVAWTHLERGEPDEAIRYLDGIAAPTPAELRLRRRAVAARDGASPEDADDLTDGASEVDLVLTGLSLLERANHEERALYPTARDHLHRAILMADHAHPLYHVSYTRAALSAGDREAAEAGAAALDALWPDMTSAAFFSALVFTATDPPRARRAYERVLAATARVNGDERDRSARRTYELAALAGLSQLAIQGGDLDGGAQHARRALALDPDHYAANVFLGFALSGSGRHEEAIGPLRHAVDLQPRQPRNRVILADALIELARPGDAVPVLRAELALVPDSRGAHERLVNALIAIGDADGATAELRRRLEVAPDDEDARRALAARVDADGD